jgi:hypothetical protein
MNNDLKLRWSNYLIELLIVIIGISIAFWLNNMAQNRKDQKEKTTYLTDIRNDLKTDSLRLSRNIKNNEAKIKKLQNGLALIEQKAPVDQVLSDVIEIGNYDFFNPDNFTLTSLLQSGDFKLIDSEEIKKELLRLLKIYESIDLMQNNFLQALDQNYFPMLLSKVDMIKFQAIDPAFFYEIEIKNYCAYTLNETDQHIRTYKYALGQVDKVTKLIDSELNN